VSDTLIFAIADLMLHALLGGRDGPGRGLGRGPLRVGAPRGRSRASVHGVHLEVAARVDRVGLGHDEHGQQRLQQPLRGQVGQHGP